MKRGRKELTYEVLDNAQILVKKIVDSFPDLFWYIQPDKIMVLGIQNDPPKSKNWIARISPISGVFKALAEKNKWLTKFVIETYSMDWNEMSEKEKAWIMFHELLHVVAMKTTKMFKHDVLDFSCIVKKLGVNNYSNPDITDLFGVKFDEDFVNQRRDYIQKQLEKIEGKQS